jgi:hypothetical protein
MQKRKEQRSGILYTLMQFWNEQFSLSIRYCYVPAGSGFTATGSYRDGKNNSNKTRPWMER